MKNEDNRHRPHCFVGTNIPMNHAMYMLMEKEWIDDGHAQSRSPVPLISLSQKKYLSEVHGRMASKNPFSFCFSFCSSHFGPENLSSRAFRILFSPG